MVDKKALQILLNTYWSSKGWKSPVLAPDDFEYAKAHGLMFDDRYLDHDAVVQWLLQMFEPVKLHDVTAAFLSSLSPRRLEFRSALGSYAVSRHFREHKVLGSKVCSICGQYGNTRKIDLNVLSFERYKWGGVRHPHPEYIALDLECFSAAEKVKPNSDDIDLFRQIIKTIRSLKSNEKRCSEILNQSLSRVVKSNQAERRVLIEILGYCGILKSQSYPSFFEGFVHYDNRPLPPVNTTDWTYPVCWWRGTDGINEEALEYYFGDYIR